MCSRTPQDPTSKDVDLVSDPLYRQQLLDVKAANLTASENDRTTLGHLSRVLHDGLARTGEFWNEHGEDISSVLESIGKIFEVRTRT